MLLKYSKSNEAHNIYPCNFLTSQGLLYLCPWLKPMSLLAKIITCLMKRYPFWPSEGDMRLISRHQ